MAAIGLGGPSNWGHLPSSLCGLVAAKLLDEDDYNVLYGHSFCNARLVCSHWAKVMAPEVTMLFTSSWSPHVCAFPRLELLAVSGRELQPCCLNLVTLQRLQELSLENCSLSAGELASLSCLQGLRHLRVSVDRAGAGASEELAAALRALPPSLITLHLRRLPPSAESAWAAALAERSNLQNLGVHCAGGSNLGDRELELLHALSELQGLELTGSSGSDMGYSALVLALCHSLVDVELKQCSSVNCQGLTLAALLECSCLKYLRVDSCPHLDAADVQLVLDRVKHTS